MLSERENIILKTLVSDYIDTAMPVGSESVVQKHRLPFSPATIRNEMAVLEKAGFIARPHTSAGGVPSDKGYRYYIEYLIEPEALPLAEQYLLRHLFFQVEKELEAWIGLAASMLARLVNNVSIVTPPKTSEPRLKRLELVSLHEFVALLVLILDETRLREHLMSFREAITQEELSTLSGRLNAIYSGLTLAEIQAKSAGLDNNEREVSRQVVHVMQAEDNTAYEEPRLEGLYQIFKQPEFARREDMLSLMEILEERRLLRSVLSQRPAGEDIKVIIGKENAEQTMHSYSLIISRYGIPGKGEGTIGILGPTRMPYGRAISSVRYLSSLLSEMVSNMYLGKAQPVAQPAPDSKIQGG